MSNTLQILAVVVVALAVMLNLVYVYATQVAFLWSLIK